MTHARCRLFAPHSAHPLLPAVSDVEDREAKDYVVDDDLADSIDILQRNLDILYWVHELAERPHRSQAFFRKLSVMGGLVSLAPLVMLLLDSSIGLIANEGKNGAMLTHCPGFVFNALLLPLTAFLGVGKVYRLSIEDMPHGTILARCQDLNPNEVEAVVVYLHRLGIPLRPEATYGELLRMLADTREELADQLDFNQQGGVPRLSHIFDELDREQHKCEQTESSQSLTVFSRGSPSSGPLRRLVFSYIAERVHERYLEAIVPSPETQHQPGVGR